MINLKESALTKDYKKKSDFKHIHGTSREAMQLLAKDKDAIVEVLGRMVHGYSHTLRCALKDIKDTSDAQIKLVNFIHEELKEGKLKLSDTGNMIKKTSIMAGIRRFERENDYSGIYLTTTEGNIPAIVSKKGNIVPGGVQLCHATNNKDVSNLVQAIETSAYYNMLSAIGSAQINYFNTHDECVLMQKEMREYMSEHRIVFDEDIFNKEDMTDERTRYTYEAFKEIKLLQDEVITLVDTHKDNIRKRGAWDYEK